MNPKTKEKLIKVALTVLAKNPRASLDDIAEEAGVGRATLYRYFKTRKSLITELSLEAERQVNEVVAGLSGQNLTAKETLLQLIEAIVPLGDSFHFFLHEPWHSGNPAIEGVYRRQMQQWEKLMDELKQEGAVDSGIPTAWMAATIDALIFAAWEKVHEGDIARNEAPKLVFKTFLNGLA